MESLAEELRRALVIRIEGLQTFLDELRGELGGSRPGLRNALELVRVYPPWLRDYANMEWDRSPGAVDRVSLVRSLLIQVTLKTLFVEQWFARGATFRVPLSLVRAVERSCEALGLGEREAVLAIGSPDNFETYVKDLATELFSGLGPPDPGIPEHLQGKKFAMMLVPRLEGGEALWRPIVVGHELAHLVAIEKETVKTFNLGKRFDWAGLKTVTPPTNWRSIGSTPRLAMFRIAQNWVEELVCDAYTVRTFGPAGVAALGEFLDVIGATGVASSTHPPAWTRIRLLVKWAGNLRSPQLRRVIAPWRAVARSARPPMDGWVTFLSDLLESFEGDFLQVVGDWGNRYRASPSVIEWAAGCIRTGVPVRERAAKGRRVADQDVLNAGWVCRAEGEVEVPVDRLVAKSLDTYEFLRHWEEAGGSAVLEETQEPLTGTAATAVLSRGEILRRLQADEESNALVLTPLLPSALGNAGVDIRLGSRFIVFRRTGTASFDPLDQTKDPRSMQEVVEKAWGEPFILHPNELVLATTLEYMALPPDLTAQVVTRSSYGRLGLITATAVEVHPHFRGCLTLELLNLGKVPLELVPGERVAQLVFHRVDPPAPAPAEKYRCPTGPEFSKVSEDADADVLRAMRLQSSLRLQGHP